MKTSAFGCLMLLIMAQVCFADADSQCRGLWIKPNPRFQHLSEADLLDEVRKHFAVETAEPKRGTVSKVILVGGHAEDTEALDALLARHPVRLVGYKDRQVDAFGLVRQKWLDGKSAKSLGETAIFNTLDSCLKSPSAAARAMVSRVPTPSDGQREYIALIGDSTDTLIKRKSLVGIGSFAVSAFLLAQTAAFSYYGDSIVFSEGMILTFSGVTCVFSIYHGFKERRMAARDFAEDCEALVERINNFDIQRDLKELDFKKNPLQYQTVRELLVVVDEANIVSILKQAL